MKLCRVCGQRGRGQCPIQSYDFCGKHHQREHKLYIFDKQQVSKNVEFDFLPSVYSESELVVEEEPCISESPILTDEGRMPLFSSTTANEGDAEGDDEDKDLEQEDLNQITGATLSSVSKDSVTMNFYARVSSAPGTQEQCLRYLRWPDRNLELDTNTPLWIRSDYQPEEIPDCPYCGAERKFEFQIMPQMLHYLLKDLHMHRAHAACRQSINTPAKETLLKVSKILDQTPAEQIPPALADAKKRAMETMRKSLVGDDNENELDWGVVSVYTCTKSCGSGVDVEEGAELGAYRDEFVWKQPSLD